MAVISVSLCQCICTCRGCDVSHPSTRACRVCDVLDPKGVSINTVLDPKGVSIQTKGERSYLVSPRCKVHLVQANYLISPSQPLLGHPTREGLLLHLTGGRVQTVRLSLYLNGFSIFKEEEELASVMLCPFSIVRNCKLPELTEGKVLKVSVFPRGLVYSFGFQEEEQNLQEKKGDDWTTDFVQVIRGVTESVFPPYTLCCTPLDGVASTHHRLMAEYLVHRSDEHVISVVYAELQATRNCVALLVLYENEECKCIVKKISIFATSVLAGGAGVRSSCFILDGHEFSARTLWEQKLWLRAISNLKVKMLHEAPDPTSEDLRNYRNAIREHVNEAGGTKMLVRSQVNPLLPGKVAAGPMNIDC